MSRVIQPRQKSVRVAILFASKTSITLRYVTRERAALRLKRMRRLGALETRRSLMHASHVMRGEHGIYAVVLCFMRLPVHFYMPIDVSTIGEKRQLAFV